MSNLEQVTTDGDKIINLLVELKKAQKEKKVALAMFKENMARIKDEIDAIVNAVPEEEVEE